MESDCHCQRTFNEFVPLLVRHFESMFVVFGFDLYSDGRLDYSGLEIERSDNPVDFLGDNKVDSCHLDVNYFGSEQITNAFENVPFPGCEFTTIRENVLHPIGDQVINRRA